MIGVIADPTKHDVVREFFELFKTPWEFHRKNQQYDVVVCSGNQRPDVDANLVVVYAGRKVGFDDQAETQVSRRTGAGIVKYRDNRIPIYGETVAFNGRDTRGNLLTDENSGQCVAYVDEHAGIRRARIGYDLFDEVRRLLTVGQPAANADIPALELHIAFLRNLIVESGLGLVEIPPVPDGFQFIVCLTHDVDHPSIRQHKLDRTILGFLLRAAFGSLIDTLRKQMHLGDAMKNWVAAVKLPLVYMGLAKDFWRDFDERYMELEKGLPSTFFVIPRKRYSGKHAGGSAPALRAAHYEARELTDTICKLKGAGCEVGLHGIDAWLNEPAACKELEEIRRLTGGSEIGVRMHWLYYDGKSPAALDEAGAAYDSTIGYNETVGYRAGTTQVYKPLEAEQLLELPMHAMDTAMFYPAYLGLSAREAKVLLDSMVDNAVEFGGCLTVNWHDRSTAPERLWGGCYRELIQELKSRRVWFSTGGQATAWFRKRRSVVFERYRKEPGGVRSKLPLERRDDLPGLRLRIYEPRKVDPVNGHLSHGYFDMVVEGDTKASVRSESRI